LGSQNGNLASQIGVLPSQIHDLVSQIDVGRSQIGNLASQNDDLASPDAVLGSPKGDWRCRNGVWGSANGLWRFPDGVLQSANGLLRPQNGLPGSPKPVWGHADGVVPAPPRARKPRSTRASSVIKVATNGSDKRNCCRSITMLVGFACHDKREHQVTDCSGCLSHRRPWRSRNADDYRLQRPDILFCCSSEAERRRVFCSGAPRHLEIQLGPRALPLCLFSCGNQQAGRSDWHRDLDFT